MTVTKYLKPAAVCAALISILNFTGCNSTAYLNKENPSITAVENKSSINMKEEFVKYEFFTQNTGGKYFASPNEKIADYIEANVSEKNSFAAKNDALNYLQKEYGVNYIPSKKNAENFVIKCNDGKIFYINKLNGKYFITDYKILLNDEAVQMYDQLTSEYEIKKDEYLQKQEEINHLKSVTVEKTELVPFTAIHNEQKQVVVTKYRPVQTDEGVKQEPYNDVQLITVHEPHTEYRMVTTTETNPDYDPEKAAVLEMENDALKVELEILEEKISLLELW